MSLSHDFINKHLNHYLSSPSSFAKEVLLVKPYWYQDDLFEAVPVFDAIFVLKGRQIGISWACAIVALWFASTHALSKSLILSLNLDQSQELINHIKDILDKFDEKDLGEFGILEPIFQRGLLSTKIHLKNGALIEAKGCTRPRADNIRSRRANLKIVDEAILLYDSMLSAIEPVTIRGGKSIYVSTAGAEGCYFHRSIAQHKEKKLEDTILFELPTCQIDEETDKIVKIICPDITLKFLRRERERLGELNFKREFCCQWLGSSNQIFPAESNYRVSEILQVKGLYYAGLDIGRTIRPSVFGLIKGTPSKACLVKVRVWRPKTPFEKIANDLAIINSQTPFKLVFDEHGVGAGMTEHLKKRGIRARGIKVSRPQKNKIIFSLASALESNLKIPKEFDHTLYELRNYYGEIGKGTSLFNFFSITTDDHVDMIAYAWEAMPKKHFPRGLGGPSATQRRVFE